MEGHLHTSSQSRYEGYLRSFQYAMPNNVVCLNKQLYNYVLSSSHLCSFLQNGRRNKSPILLSHSCKRYLESSSGLFNSLIVCIFHSEHQRPPFLAFIMLLMIQFLPKITHYFYSNYIYTIPENTGFYIVQNF